MLMYMRNQAVNGFHREEMQDIYFYIYICVCTYVHMYISHGTSALDTSGIRQFV